MKRVLGSIVLLWVCGVFADTADEALSLAQRTLAYVEKAEKRPAMSEALAKLAQRLPQTLDAGGRAALETEVEEEAGDLATLSKEARGRIQRALRARAVRRRFGLPALTLLGG